MVKRRVRRKKAALLSKAVPIEQTEDFIRMVIYGKIGFGKTTLACTFPKPLLLVDIFERGSRSVRNVKGINRILIRSWEELEQLRDELQDAVDEGSFPYRTVVFDNVTQAVELARRKTLEEKGPALRQKTGKGGDVRKGSTWGNMTLQMHGDVGTNINNWVGDIREILMESCHIVFIAQQRYNEGSEETFFDPDTGAEYTETVQAEIGPRLPPAICDYVDAAVDYIGQMIIRIPQKRIKRKGRIRIKPRPEEFALRLGRSALVTTKVRTDKGRKFPHFIVDPDFDKLMLAIGVNGHGKRYTDNPPQSERRPKLRRTARRKVRVGASRRGTRGRG